MSSRRAEDVPLDPADVEDMRLRIEAHQRAADADVNVLIKRLERGRIRSLGSQG